LTGVQPIPTRDLEKTSVQLTGWLAHEVVPVPMTVMGVQPRPTGTAAPRTTPRDCKRLADSGALAVEVLSQHSSAKAEEAAARIAKNVTFIVVDEVR